MQSDPVRGPVIRVWIGVSGSRVETIVGAGSLPPAPVVAHLLVDTGASCTVIDEQVLAPLSLAPTGATAVRSVTTGASTEERFTYDVSVTLSNGGQSRLSDSVRIIATDLKVRGIDGLLGRDLLASCVFVYDGPTDIFSLAF